MKNTVLSLILLSLVVGCNGDLVDDIKDQINAFSAHFYSHAVVVSFVNSTHSFDIATGYSDFAEDKKVLATTSNRFLFGSITKLYTAVAIMKHVENKVLDLDEPVYPYVDYYLKSNGTTFATLFGEQAVNITIRHLLQMRAGLREYDNQQLRDWQNANPDKDFTPIDVLNYIPDKTLRCDPGKCGAYASIHFTVLGFVLARLAGAETWDVYDQSSAFMEYQDKLIFPSHGPAKDFGTPSNPMIHGYEQKGWIDVFNMSVLAGWTCGNLITDTPTQASFLYDLLGNGSQSLLSQDSINQMVDFQFLESSTSWQGEYGLGVQVLPQGTPESGSYYGHGGETYGFETTVGYNKKLDFSLAIASNMESVAGWHLGTLHTDIYKLLVNDICGEECDSVISIGCYDQGGFVDEGGADCAGWKGYNCTDAIEEWGYTHIGKDMLVANCPVTCLDVECPDPKSSTPYAVYSEGQTGYYMHSRVTYRGQTDGVIGVSGGTIDDCIKACDTNPNCNSFSATITGTLKCYLKSRCIFPSDLLLPESQSIDYESIPLRTYFKPCREGNYWHTGSKSFPHNPSLALQQLENSDVSQCAAACDAHSDCYSFTVDDPNSSSTTCFLTKGKVTPDTIQTFYYTPIGGATKTVCMYSIHGNLESCILSCDATQPTLAKDVVLATCKSFTFNEQAKTCCLSDNIVREGEGSESLYGETFRSDVSFSPTFYAAAYQEAAQTQELVSLGWCLDWCNDYHFIKKVECIAFSYSGSTCKVYTSTLYSLYFSVDSQVWTRKPNRRSYWKSAAPVGCCVANSKAFDNITFDECSLKSHRVVFHEGELCPDDQIMTEVPTTIPDTSSPERILAPTSLPTSSPIHTSLPTAIHSNTVAPTSIPTQVVTLSPTGVPLPATDIPSIAADVVSTNSFQTGFIIIAVIATIIFAVLLKLYWKYIQRGELLAQLKEGGNGETWNDLTEHSPKGEEAMELAEHVDVSPED